MKQRMLFLGIGSLALFACLAVLVSSGRLLAIDQAALLSINSQSSPGLDTFFLALTQFGGALFVTCAALVLLGAAIIQKRYTLAAFMAIIMSGMILCNLLLKSLFERPRPDLWEWLIHETSYSFPSGHATASMALAIVVIAFFWHSKWKWLVVVTASLYVVGVSFSRLYLGVHYPSDIVGGWLLSITIASFTAFTIMHMKSLRKTRSDS